MPRGVLITFEGLDGSGKSTQIKRLASWIEKHLEEIEAESRNNSEIDRRVPVVTRQPGGTVTGERIRALTLDSRSTGLAPMTELALMFADRAQAIAEVIEPALNEGRIVLCDRFTDSTEAYQGGGRGLGSSLVLDLHRLTCGNLHPDLTLLLLPPLEACLARAQRRNERSIGQNGRDEGRFEREELGFHRRVCEKYREIAAREPQRMVLIEGELTIDEVHARIVEAVTHLLGVRAGG
ncbi:MAG: dTMP kinase [Terracidiphilus sp.]